MMPKYPLYRLKVRLQDIDREIILKDPFQFDQAFSSSLEPADQLSVKIHFCCQLLKSLKKQTNNKDTEVIQHYNELLAKYSSELIFLY
jgi:hypothetical protein